MAQHSQDGNGSADSEAGSTNDDGITRRALGKAVGAGAGALALGPGLSGSVAADDDVVQSADGQYDNLDVNADFRLLANAWSAYGYEVENRIELYSDGSYGWEWDRDSTGIGTPNYPEVIFGTKPWSIGGIGSTTDALPRRRGDIDELTMTIDVEQTPSGGEWNLAEEWWLTADKFESDGVYELEIMLVLDWSSVHGQKLGSVTDPGVATDQFGNRIDYWTSFGQQKIYRVDGGLMSGSVDLTAIIDDVSARFGPSDDLYLSGVELGNEYWDDTTGDTVVNQFDVAVNGTTYESGPGGRSSAPGPVDSGVYKLRNSKSGLVAEVGGRSFADGADVNQWPYSDLTHKQWDVQPDGDAYTITAQHSDKLLTADDGNVVQDSSSGPSDSQRWTFEAVDGDEYLIRNVANGNVLTIARASTEWGATIVTFPYDGSDRVIEHQHWELRGV